MLFKVNGKCFTEACRHNNRIMKEAKTRFYKYGIDYAAEYIEEEVRKLELVKGRTKKLSDKGGEYFICERKKLGLPARMIAELMGYSTAHYLRVEEDKQRPSVIFENTFNKIVKKLKKVLTL